MPFLSSPFNSIEEVNVSHSDFSDEARKTEDDWC